MSEEQTVYNPIHRPANPLSRDVAHLRRELDELRREIDVITKCQDELSESIADLMAGSAPATLSDCVGVYPDGDRLVVNVESPALDKIADALGQLVRSFNETQVRTVADGGWAIRTMPYGVDEL